ncbi:MAG: hypothetical protein ACKO21_01530 [Nodosilinea sp.]
MITLATPQPIGEKCVTLHGLTWQTYQQILQALPPSRATRLRLLH